MGGGSGSGSGSGSGRKDSAWHMVTPHQNTVKPHEMQFHRVLSHSVPYNRDSLLSSQVIILQADYIVGILRYNLL